MSRRIATMLLMTLTAFGLVFSLMAQAPAGAEAAKGGGKGGGKGGAPGGGGKGGAAKGRPALFFKEEWKQSPPGSKECPVVQRNCEHELFTYNIGNPNLELKLYSNAMFDNGKTAESGGIALTGDDGDETNPSHMWTGTCNRGCMAAFRHKTAFADLSGLARIKMNTKMSGLHQARIAVKLADGTWLIGDKGIGNPTDWLITETSFSELKWMRLNVERMVPTGSFIANPDLTKVDEIGIVDLLPGSGHGTGGWADVAQIEVYGGTVPR